jgi:hypothetical protein
MVHTGVRPSGAGSVWGFGNSSLGFCHARSSTRSGRAKRSPVYRGATRRGFNSSRYSLGNAGPMSASVTINFLIRNAHSRLGAEPSMR